MLPNIRLYFDATTKNYLANNKPKKGIFRSIVGNLIFYKEITMRKRFQT